jgi:biotin-(acetyl-CoA carboxylase) ligase
MPICLTGLVQGASQCGVTDCRPRIHRKLERWWTEARKRLRRVDRKRFDTMVISTAWTLWKQRNARAFGNNREQKTVEQMVDQIKDDFHLCERAKRGGRLDIARE